jgi:pyruvate kinase
LTPSSATARRLALYRNVRPLHFPVLAERDASLLQAERLLLDKGVVKRGDLIVLTVGEPMGQAGGTNTLKIVRVGEHA